MPAPVDFYGLPGSGVLRFYTGDGTTISSMDGLRPLTAGVTHIVGVSRVGDRVAQHLNGLPNGSGMTAAPSVDLGMPLTIGTRDDFVTQLQGDLSELLIYQGGLSAQEEQDVQAYLAARHHIPLVSLANAAPTVTLTAPTAGATFAAPAEIALAATAADTDGSVVRVEFMVNGTVVATDTTSPYEASVSLTVPGVQELSVRAVDNLGASGVSAPVVVTIASETAPPLPAFTQLSLWLRADKDVTVEGGGVSAWLDQSGKLNHAAQPNATKRPQLVEDQLNGKPVLRFDGADDDLTAPSTTSLAHTGPLSSFFVVRFDDFATYRAVWGKTASHLPRATDYYLMPDSGVPRLFRGGVGANGFLEGGFGVEAGEFLILGFEHDGNWARHYYNWEISAEGIINVTLEDTGDPLTIGSRSDGVTRLAGDLAELVIYNRVLNDAERAQVLDYLADKYDILVTHSVTDVPMLSVTVSGSQLTLFWPPVNGWTLQESPSLETDSWADVPNVVGNTATVPLSGAGFYRLARY